jgi:hyperosmotically inducible periplasmic protein
MSKKLRRNSTVILAATLAGVLLSLPQVSWSAAGSFGASAQGQSSITNKAAKRLDKKELKDVNVTVNDGIATLTGTVSLYEYKVDAANRVLHVDGVQAVRNQIKVGGPSIPDRQLRAKLAKALTYNRVGYGNAFDAITVGVQNGVVTLGGHVHNYMNRNSDLGLVATTPGVKGIVDNMQVDPLSPMDNRIRIEEFRAIYGFPGLRKYDVNPARPIRIAVQNGHVELYGMVDSQADKNMAGIRANTVPGVFSVQNDLQVAGKPSERQ